MVLDTGLPFEVVAGFTQAQFMEIQQAARRREEGRSMAGLLGLVGSGNPAKVTDDTEAFDERVRQMKKATGKDTLSLWEVI